MATINWKGGAAAVAQVSDATVDTMDTGSTYTVTIGGYTVSTPGVTDTATTAANLVTALLASTNPYFAAVTWSVPSGSTVRGTADVAGAPFLAVLSVAGGTGTVTDFSDTTACTGPHHADDGENYSGGSLPTTSDLLVVSDGPSILYGLTALSAVALARVEIRQSFTASVGLEPSQFATSLDGDTTDASVPEYRGAYLELTADEIITGEHIGAGAPVGSSRLALEQKKAGASVLDVVNTSANTVNSRPAVRFKAAHASADVIVRAAPGGVGFAVESGEATTIGDLYVVDESPASAVYVSEGVTLTSYQQHGGTSVLAAAATITSVECMGGTLRIAGYDYLITTLDVTDGTVIDTHENTGGAEWTTINIYGGVLQLPRGNAGTSRDYSTMNLFEGRIEADWSALSGTETIGGEPTAPARRSLEIAAL